MAQGPVHCCSGITCAPLTTVTTSALTGQETCIWAPVSGRNPAAPARGTSLKYFICSFTHLLQHLRGRSLVLTGGVWFPVLQGLTTCLGKPTDMKRHIGKWCNGDLGDLRRCHTSGVMMAAREDSGGKQEGKGLQDERGQHPRWVSNWLVSLTGVPEHLGPLLLYPWQTKKHGNVTNSCTLWNPTTINALKI